MTKNRIAKYLMTYILTSALTAACIFILAAFIPEVKEMATYDYRVTIFVLLVLPGIIDIFLRDKKPSKQVTEGRKKYN